MSNLATGLPGYEKKRIKHCLLKIKEAYLKSGEFTFALASLQFLDHALHVLVIPFNFEFFALESMICSFDLKKALVWFISIWSIFIHSQHIDINLASKN
jgi:hypothetical protein